MGYDQVLQDGFIRHCTARLTSVSLLGIVGNKFLGSNVRLLVRYPGGKVLVDSLESSSRSKKASDLEFNLLKHGLDTIVEEDFNVSIWHTKKGRLSCSAHEKELASFWLHTGYFQSEASYIVPSGGSPTNFNKVVYDMPLRR